MNKKIVIFQYEWLLQNYSVDLACKLAELNYEVVFLGFEITKYGLSDPEQFENKQVQFIEFRDIEKKLTVGKTGFLSKLVFSVKWHFYKIRHQLIFGRYPHHKDINRSILYQSYQYLKRIRAVYFIGIEKKGLIWAGIMSSIFKTKLVYYNLELFIEDMINHEDWKHYQPFRTGEIRYHQKCVATIIQDRFRADALEEYNKVKTERIYLPVAVSGEANKLPSSYLQKKFGLKDHVAILLYFGVIGPYRYCEEILELAPFLPENIKLIYHGIEFINFTEEKLKSRKESEYVFFSLDKEDEGKIPEIIASANIGLALYHNEYLNDRLIAYSSQKIAYYFKCGIPVIAFKNETFEDLYRQYKCVYMINAISEIPEACNHLLNNYQMYREEAFMAYEKYYRFENVSSSIQNFF